MYVSTSYWRRSLHRARLSMKRRRTRITCFSAIVVVVLLVLATRTHNHPRRQQEDEPPDDAWRYGPQQLVSWTPIPVERSKSQSDLPGSLGKVFLIPANRSQEAKKRFDEYQLNVVASDMIPLNRTLPDVRPAECRLLQLPPLLPRASIIIVFHQEPWSMLLRTVWSVINRSPRQLLQEILLVDDASEVAELGAPLERYVVELAVPVRVLRLKERSGLVRGRLLGAENAQAEVLVFLDAHCECTAGWLENLLTRVVRDCRTVATPIIDSIKSDTLKYSVGSANDWGGLSWTLNFRWYQIPDRDQKRRNHDTTEPIRSPIIAGGLLAVDREYFYRVGAYDEGMQIWASENLEMSFRVWQCGGTLEIVPCSRVGHVYRKSKPYSFPGGTTAVINKNKNRVAAVWMDEWENFFHKVKPKSREDGTGDVNERKELRSRLKCKSFRWYLQNVYPEAPFPLTDQYIGSIRNEGAGKCLDTMSRKTNEPAGLISCHGQGGNQMFLYANDLRIVYDDQCLTAQESVSKPVRMSKCYSKTDEQQHWKYDITTKNLLNLHRQCLTSSGTEIVVKPCDTSSSAQRWIMDTPSSWRPTH